MNLTSRVKKDPNRKGPFSPIILQNHIKYTYGKPRFKNPQKQKNRKSEKSVLSKEKKITCRGPPLFIAQMSFLAVRERAAVL